MDCLIFDIFCYTEFSFNNYFILLNLLLYMFVVARVDFYAHADLYPVYTIQPVFKPVVQPV